MVDSGHSSSPNRGFVVVFFCILALTVGQMTILEHSSELDDPRRVSSQLYEDESVLVYHKTTLYHWNKDGILLNKISAPGTIDYCTFISGYYLVTTDTEMLCFDVSGKPVDMFLDKNIQRIHYLTCFNGRCFAQSRDIELWYRNNYSFLANEVAVSTSAKGLAIHGTGLSFVKANKAIQQTFFNFRKIFLVPNHRKGLSGPLFLVMNQMENKVYLYDWESIRKENEDGQRKATEVPFIEVPLKKYRKGSGFFKPELTIIKNGTSEKLVGELTTWWNQQGVIRLFQGYAHGYMIAYEMPVYDEQGLVIDSQMGIQKISMDFSLNGPLIVESGTPLGINKFRGEADPQFLMLDGAVDKDSGEKYLFIKFLAL